MGKKIIITEEQSNMVESIFQCGFEDLLNQVKKYVYRELGWEDSSVSVRPVVQDNMIIVDIVRPLDRKWEEVQEDSEIINALKNVGRNYEKQFKERFKNFCQAGVKGLIGKLTFVNISTSTTCIKSKFIQSKNDYNIKVARYDDSGSTYDLGPKKNYNGKNNVLKVQVGLFLETFK